MPLRVPKHAMRFDGIDDYVVVPDDPSLHVSSMTLEVMVKVLTVEPLNVNTHLMFKYESGADAYGLLMDWGAAPISMYVKKGSDYYQTGKYFMTDREWHHVVGTYDADTGELKLVVDNGEVIKTATAPTGLTFTNTASMRTPAGQGRRMMIAYMRMYDRVLSEEEIRHNYLFPDNPIRDGLVLWLHARPEYVDDNTWVDLSGLGNNATLNGPVLEQVIKAPKRYVLSFDGMDDHVLVPHSSSINLGRYWTSYAVEAFVFASEIPSDDSHFIVKPGESYPFSVVLDKYGKWEVRVYDGFSMARASADASIQRWVHLVGNIMRGGRIELWVDGEMADMKIDLSTEDADNTAPIRIGYSGWGAPFKGKIAYVRIYNRKLSQEDIIFNKEHPLNPVRDGLVLWLHADEDDVNGTTWRDRSGNNNNATLYGATLERLIKEAVRKKRVVRKALYFDGEDDYVEVPHGDEFNLTDEATFEIMFYKLRSSVRGDLLGKPNTTWHAILVGAYDYLVFQIYDGETWRPCATSTKIEPMRWYHAIVRVKYRTPSEGALVDFFIDGELDVTRVLDYSAKITNTSDPLVGKVSNNWDGKIAYVRIYSRALSDSEIAWNYYHPDNPVRNGLVLWLHWDSIDTDNNVWRDKSGYGNDGTINGATLEQIIKPSKR